MGEDRARDDVAEAQPRQVPDGVAVLVEACGEPHRVAQGEAAEAGGKTRIAVD
jgi:hypothetical protein